jgi:hypothetical protein
MKLCKTKNTENHKILQMFLTAEELSNQPELETYFAIENPFFDKNIKKHNNNKDYDIDTKYTEKYSIISRITECNKSNEYFQRDIASIFKYENIDLKDNDIILWINGMAANPKLKTSLKSFFKLQKEQFDYIDEYFKNSDKERIFVMSDVRNENFKENVMKKYGFKITKIDLEDHFGIFKIMKK